MIVVTGGVSLTEMSSCIMMPNMKIFIHKKNIFLFWNSNYREVMTM